MKLRKRDVLAFTGWGLALAAPPLEPVSPVAYFVLWYVGWALAGIWLVLDILAGRR